MRIFHVYILASRSRVLYIGVTSNLRFRVQQHKRGCFSTFTSKYRVRRLVYAEEHRNARAAIEREKQLKGWTRLKKRKLIEEMNPAWEDLSQSLH